MARASRKGEAMTASHVLVSDMERRTDLAIAKLAEESRLRIAEAKITISEVLTIQEFLLAGRKIDLEPNRAIGVGYVSPGHWVGGAVR